MAIPPDQLAEAALLFGGFVNRVPERARHQVRMDYRFEGNSIILFESRLRLKAPNEWIECPVAKFTYVQTTKSWKLLVQDRNLRWRGYENFPESPSLSALCKEVDEDPTNIFWG